MPVVIQLLRGSWALKPVGGSGVHAFPGSTTQPGAAFLPELTGPLRFSQ